MTFIKKTTNQFKEELSKINPNIEVVGEYRGSHFKIKVLCNLDGHIWEPFAYNLLRGKGCPKCSKTYKRTPDEFVQELSKINPNIEILGKFIDTRTSINVRCNLDGNIWEPTAKNLLEGTGCPICARELTSSKNEKLLLGLIQENYPNLIIDPNNRTIIDPLEIDIAIHDINLYIEWNGSYWHSLPDAIYKDNIKKEILGDNLIQIMDIGGEDLIFVLDQFNNTIKPEIEKRLTILGIP